MLTKEGLETLLQRYEHLAGEAERAKRMDESFRLKEQRIQTLGRDVESLRRSTDTHRTEMAEAKLKIAEWEAYAEQLRGIIGPRRKKDLPKKPTAFDDIPF